METWAGTSPQGAKMTDKKPLLIFVLLILALLLLPIGTEAQRVLPPRRTSVTAASTVFAELTKRSGVTIYCDNFVAGERLPMLAPDDTVTEANLESYIIRAVGGLPEGVTWAKLYLPPPPKDTMWKSEDVIAYAFAQARLYGTIGAGGDDEKREILAQVIPKEKAAPIIETLNLKPVYVVIQTKKNFTGVWQTTFGAMRLTQRKNRVTGTYTSGNGTLDGTVGRNGVLRFRWVETGTGALDLEGTGLPANNHIFYASISIYHSTDSSYRLQAESVKGGGAGAGRFTLSEDGDSFKGTWNSQTDPDAGGSEWVGTRTKPQP